MSSRPPMSTLTDPLLPYTPRCRSPPGGIDEDSSRLRRAQPLGVQQVFAFGREACHHDDDVALLQELVEPYKSDTLTALVRRACRDADPGIPPRQPADDRPGNVAIAYDSDRLALDHPRRHGTPWPRSHLAELLFRGFEII